MGIYAFKDILTILQWLDAGKTVRAEGELRPVLAFMNRCGLIDAAAQPHLTERGRTYLRSVAAEAAKLEAGSKERGG